MADDPSVLAGTFTSRRMLSESEKAMEDILKAFEVMADRIKDGESDVTPAEISKVRTVLAQVRSRLVDEVKKHEERVFHSNGLSAGAPMDFDRVRSEIGSKLNRIRDARRSG